MLFELNELFFHLIFEQFIYSILLVTDFDNYLVKTLVKTLIKTLIKTLTKTLTKTLIKTLIKI